MRGERREEKEGREGGKERGEEALLVMWPTKLSALKPPLRTASWLEQKETY